MRSTIASLVALVANATAYTITSPSGGCIDVSQPIPVTWTFPDGQLDPPTVSFALTNRNNANPVIEKLYENLVVDGTKGSVILPGLDHDLALNYSKLDYGVAFEIWMVPANAAPPYNSQLKTKTIPPFKVVAPGTGNVCPTSA